jgi:hypothetical protein
MEAKNPKGHDVVIDKASVDDMFFLPKYSQYCILAGLAAEAHSHACGNKSVK